MDLPTFLLARIAEDEETARAAPPGPWRVDDTTYAEVIVDVGSNEIVSGGRWGGEASVFDTTETAVHIARHDPARVLAECAAKRAIVELHTGDHECPVKDPRPRTTYVHPDFVYANDPTLRLLAQPFVDHPDFDPAWR